MLVDKQVFIDDGKCVNSFQCENSIVMPIQKDKILIYVVQNLVHLVFAYFLMFLKSRCIMSSCKTLLLRTALYEIPSDLQSNLC